MQFDYFYPEQADQYAFYRIPRRLFTDNNFKELTAEAKMLNCGDKKATRLMGELEKCSLIERDRRGLGKPNLIYVKISILEYRQMNDSRLVKITIQESAIWRLKVRQNNEELILIRIILMRVILILS